MFDLDYDYVKFRDLEISNDEEHVWIEVCFTKKKLVTTLIFFFNIDIEDDCITIYEGDFRNQIGIVPNDMGLLEKNIISIISNKLV